jgi:hypothetical protein
MTTRRELEHTIATQAVDLCDLREAYQKSEKLLDDADDKYAEVAAERDTLLSENAALREQLRVARDISDLIGKQSLEFCAKYKHEEKRANAAIDELNRLKKAKVKR